MVEVSVERIVTGPLRQNCYLVKKPDRSALIIDPGSDADKIIAQIEADNSRPVAILNTHAHFDHIGAVAKLQTAYEIPFYLQRRDDRLLHRANSYSLVFGSKKPVKIPSVGHWIDSEETIKVGGFEIDVMFTPGHTKGSICLSVCGLLFTGDTLFRGSIGRLDFPGSDRSSMKSSLQRLSELPETTQFFPGHGGSGTVGEELKNNKEFKEMIT